MSAVTFGVGAMPADTQLRDDALSIWQSGVDAVRADRLVCNVIQRSSDALMICGRTFPLKDLGRIAVVGAGKAGAGMAAAIEEALGPELVDHKLEGWVNVPADCVRTLRKIQLHAARPAGVNEPTEAGVAGSRRILDIVSRLGLRDLCLVLISGGGSALLPAPIPQISLADKQSVTRFLMQSGATIGELNAVRKPLSQIKGGGLGRAIRAGAALTLIISDVIGDPLDVIASGPTVADSGTPAQALEVLRKFSAEPPAVPQSVFDALRAAAANGAKAGPLPPGLTNHVIGNNAVAVAAASVRATELGYAVRSLGSDNEGEANNAGRELAELCLSLRANLSRAGQSACLLSGGEPVVRLTRTQRPGKGGRNQQLVLAAIDRLWDDGMPRLAILSGGTDGEDGPTDAAGAIADAELIRRARAAGLQPRPFLDRNDAYHFFEPIRGLIKTGPTHTNVMDLRVALVAAE
jgi:hydroxypyruvate reductase